MNHLVDVYFNLMSFPFAYKEAFTFTINGKYVFKFLHVRYENMFIILNDGIMSEDCKVVYTLESNTTRKNGYHFCKFEGESHSNYGYTLLDEGASRTVR